MNSNKIEAAYKKTSLFIPNHGQYSDDVAFSSKTKDTQFYFTKTQIISSMLLKNVDGAEDESLGIALSLGFVNANDSPLITGVEPTDSKINYFIGNDKSRWKSNVPTYDGIKYNGIWTGIDLMMEHSEKGIKLNWIVASGTNPKDIRLHYDGANSLSVRNDGKLLITHDHGAIEEDTPVAYQVINGNRIDIPCSYVMHGEYEYGFLLEADYNQSYDLVIDPLLPYASLLGGNSYETGEAIAVDNMGCAYVTGNTTSSNFPTTPGAFQPTRTGGLEAVFVTKFSEDGSHLIYSTYLSGTNGRGYGKAITVDSAGFAYITGTTDATDFPVTPGAFQQVGGGLNDVFVTKLSQDGSSLVYSTYLSGTAGDHGSAIAVDEGGFAYVGGETISSDFPITPGAFQQTKNANIVGFITKLFPDGSALVYSTYLSGNSTTSVESLTIDTQGCVYATGQTQSTDFPVTSGAFQTTNQGGNDIFVTKFSENGSSLVYSTLVGGDGNDKGESICIDDERNAYVTGYTSSSHFPVTSGAAQTVRLGNYDSYVFKLNSDGTNLVYCTLLGGSDEDYGRGLVLTSQNRICVTGETASADFPTTPWVGSMPFLGAYMSFITMISEDGSSFIVSTLVGGDTRDFAFGIAKGVDDSIYITGTTTSTNFPATEGAFQTKKIGGSDAYVYRTLFPMFAKASVMIKKL